MHGITTIHALNTQAAEAKEILNKHNQAGPLTGADFTAQSAHKDIVFVQYGAKVGVTFTNSHGQAFLLRTLDGLRDKVGPIYLLNEGEKVHLCETANIHGVSH